MIALSIQDQFDGTSKVQQLRDAIGETFYGGDKIISISKDGNSCVVEYKGKRFKQASSLTWNRFFF